MTRGVADGGTGRWRPGDDPREHAHLLHEVFDAVLRGDAGPRAPRSLVSESWQRSLAAHVDPDRAHPAGRGAPTPSCPTCAPRTR